MFDEIVLMHVGNQLQLALHEVQRRKEGEHGRGLGLGMSTGEKEGKHGGKMGTEEKEGERPGGDKYRGERGETRLGWMSREEKEGEPGGLSYQELPTNAKWSRGPKIGNSFAIVGPWDLSYFFFYPFRSGCFFFSFFSSSFFLLRVALGSGVGGYVA